MNAEETLARLCKEYDVTLPSGLQVTIRLPRIRDCIIAGNVPLPVLAHIQDVASNGQADLSPEELASMARFQDEIVRRSLIKIDGEDVVMTPEAVAALEQDDYDALVAYGTRQTPVPTNAVSPT